MAEYHVGCGALGKEKFDFCTNCRKETGYTLQYRNITKVVKNKKCTFNLTVAICDECGKEMCPPGLIDKNIQEFENNCQEI